MGCFGCSVCFRLFRVAFGCFRKFWLLKSSRLFSFFQFVLDSVRLLMFLMLSLVVHVVQLDVGSFRSS